MHVHYARARSLTEVALVRYRDAFTRVYKTYAQDAGRATQVSNAAMYLGQDLVWLELQGHRVIWICFHRESIVDQQLHVVQWPVVEEHLHVLQAQSRRRHACICFVFAFMCAHTVSSMRTCDQTSRWKHVVHLAHNDSKRNVLQVSEGMRMR